MKYSFVIIIVPFILLFVLNSCKSNKEDQSVSNSPNISCDFHQIISETRRSGTKNYEKCDRRFIANEGIYYISEIKTETPTIREFEFPSTSSNIGKKRYYKKENARCSMQLIDKKSFDIDHNLITVYKFYFDRLLSSDEESLKFYCDEYGLFYEKYWVNTVIKTDSILRQRDSRIIRLLNTALESDSIFYNENQVLIEY